METRSESHYQAEGLSGPVPGALLVFSENAPVYRPIVLQPSGAVVLGRDDMGGVGVPDERVSRAHLELEVQGPLFRVRDLGSRNGTFLDGERLEGERTARPGTVLRVSHTVLVLVADLRPYLAGYVAVGEYVIGPTMQRALDRAVLARRGEGHLLVLGESGAGKELIARRFYEAGERHGRFVAINCAEVPSSVAERLLFGAVRGAHTDARADVDGYFQAADGGVLFLDEIAELGLEVQAKLLRTVETGEVLRLGATSTRKVSVRVVAASHQDLRAAVAQQRFRQDLFFRLSQVELLVPPLRERPEDIPWLIQRGLGPAGLSAHASLVEAALLRRWPGNVRELRSEVEKAAASATLEGSKVVRAGHLQAVAGTSAAARAPAPAPAAPAGPADPGQISREQVVAALAGAPSISAAQRRLGLKYRNQLYRLMNRFELNVPARDAAEAAGEDAE
jgi:transcriptional regulator of acetoin/glycerol metabolism